MGNIDISHVDKSGFLYISEIGISEQDAIKEMDIYGDRINIDELKWRISCSIDDLKVNFFCNISLDEDIRENFINCGWLPLKEAF